MHNLKNYWYIFAESDKLKKNQVISNQICNERLVAFRGEDGAVCIMQDRCLHRCAKLSKGSVKNGKLTCPYHGWVYNNKGNVISIPAHVGKENSLPPNSSSYVSLEQEGYIYVFLGGQKSAKPDILPYAMPEYKNPNFKRIRLNNYFNNSLANCVENFIDIPHTAYVHRGIFRKVRSEKITAVISRKKEHMQIDYQNEIANLGSFSKLLNPKGKPIIHQDNFYGPNITHVIYKLENKWTYMITSQSIPVNETETRVYTEICYNFGILNYLPFTKPLLRQQAQKVITQDVEILNQQMEVIKQYGEKFWHTSADLIHCNIVQILEVLIRGESIAKLADIHKEITFWV